MRKSQSLCSQLLFGTPDYGDSVSSACSLRSIVPSKPNTPMSKNQRHCRSSRPVWQVSVKILSLNT